MSEIEALCAKLRAGECSDAVPHKGSTWNLRNPDGLEAAALIEKLVEALANRPEKVREGDW